MHIKHGRRCGLQPSRPFLAWPWKFCVVPSALSYAGGPSYTVRSQAHPFLMIHARSIFVSRRKQRLPYARMTSNNTADPHTMKNIFTVCGPALFAKYRKHPDVGLLPHEEIHQHKGCPFEKWATQAKHWCSFPARLNGARCPKGEKLAGGVSRSACLSERNERVARRVVTDQFFRAQ